MPGKLIGFGMGTVIPTR